MQHRRIVDAAFAVVGRDAEPGGRDELGLHADRARARRPARHHGPHLADANPLPDDLRAIPLVDPKIEHTIGLSRPRRPSARRSSPSCSACSRRSSSTTGNAEKGRAFTVTATTFADVKAFRDSLTGEGKQQLDNRCLGLIEGGNPPAAKFYSAVYTWSGTGTVKGCLTPNGYREFYGTGRLAFTESRTTESGL